MRTVLVTALLVAASSASATDKPRFQLPPHYAALVKFDDCAKGKAAEFAALDGPMSEIAAAAISACMDKQREMEAAYREFYVSQGGEEKAAMEWARSTINGLAREVHRSLPGVIAEARLDPQGN